MFNRDHGEDLFNDVRGFIRRFWAPPSEAALDAMVLWTAHTHAVHSDNRLVFETTPRLFLCSTGPASGKSTALQMLELLSGRSKRIADPTAPALLALIDQERATVLIDELDTLMGAGAGGRSTRTVMLEGYSEGGAIPRGSSAAPGGHRMVSCFAPMAFAGMRQNFISNPKLDALRTRTIMLLCKPRTNEVVESYRRRLHAGQARTLNAALAKWGSRHANTLADSWPEPPAGVEDRAAELWEPLLAVGEAVGGAWAERARHACRVLALGEPEEGDDEPDTPVEMLLADMARVFMGEDRLASRTIVERLQLLPNSAWKRFPNVIAAGKEIAAMLEPRGVAPRPVKLDGMTVRGYDRVDLEAAGMPVLAAIPAEQAEDDPAELPI